MDQSSPKPNQRTTNRSPGSDDRQRQATIAMTATLASDAATNPSAISPVRGQLRTRNATIPKRTGMSMPSQQ